MESNIHFNSVADLTKKWPDYEFTLYENVEATNPPLITLQYLSDPPKLRSVGHINTIYDMNDLLSKAFEIIAPYKSSPKALNLSGFDTKFDIENIIAEYGIFFAPDFPDFLMPMSTAVEYTASNIQATRNIITWGTVRTEPGTISADPPFRGIQEVKPRFREYVLYLGEKAKQLNVLVGNESNIKNEYIYVKVKAQFFDNLVQYNIWSKSNYEVERLTDWFENFMDKYNTMFREAGIVDLWFSRRVRDDTLMQTRNGYHLRSVLYYIRTERVIPQILGPISQIDVKINIENLQNLSKSNTEGLSIKESKYDKLVSKWIQKSQLGG